MKNNYKIYLRGFTIITRFILIGLCFGLSAKTFAQEPKTKKPAFNISGFVTSNIWLDSRQIDGGRDELFLFAPKPPLYDKNGNDINAQPLANFTAIATRLTFSIGETEAFGAKISALIEGDFTGSSNADINGLRLRHAYGKMRWEKSVFLFGQYWHPMFVPEVFPEVISLNTGAPFQAFNRSPLMSYRYFFGNFNIQGALIAQRDNSSDGPIGRSAEYMRNALIPNSNLQLQYVEGKHILGIMIDFKSLKPRLVTDSAFTTQEKINSTSLQFYWKYTQKDFVWRFKTTYGQNLTELSMLGGYAVHSVEPITGHETYTPTNHIFTWMGFNYGTKIQYGLFGGFAKNFGTLAENTGTYFAKSPDIDYLYRISPSICINSGSFRIASELEYTVAAYGIPDNHGKVSNSNEVANLRFLLALIYFF